MKKNLIVSATIILVIIGCSIFFRDGLTYLITSLMSLAIMGIILRNGSIVMKITRWAKANPKNAQLLITGLQIVLMVLGIFAGNNLKELGYEFSGTTTFVFSIVIVIGFLSVHLLPKHSIIAIPKVVNRQRFIFMSIALSSFVMMVITGNRIGDMYPDSPVTHAIQSIDRAVFTDDSSLHADFNNQAPDPGYKKNYEQVLINGSAMLVFASVINRENEPVASSIDSKKKSKADIKAEKKVKKFEKRLKKLMNRLEKKRLVAAGAMTGGGGFINYTACYHHLCWCLPRNWWNCCIG